MSDVPERDAPEADSLAAQAAAWVPPWARQAPADADPTDLPEPAQSAEDLAPAEPAEDLAPAEPAEDAAPAEPAEDAGLVEPTEQVGEPAEVAEAPEPVEPAEPWEQVESPEPGEARESAQPMATAELAEESFDEPDTTEPLAADQVDAESVADEVDAEQFAAAVFGDEPVAPAEAVASALVENLPPVPAVDLRPALEAILLVVDEPVTELLLAQVLEQPVEEVAAELAALAGEYTVQGRGFELRRAAGGWRLYTRPEYAAHVERFVLDGQSVRLTQAALETLAVVAYKQPVTRSRISAIRGVNCDGVVRTLVTRGLIEESGAEPETGAYLYRTSNLFLEKLGLDSVDQLPPLAPFLPDNVDEIAGDVGR